MTTAAALLASRPVDTYPFLSQPPAEKRPNATTTASDALKSGQVMRARSSSAYTSIASWAAQVYPGSPAPLSPETIGAVTPDRGSFTPSPSPSIKDFDLTTLGYASVFVHLSGAPIVPETQKAKERGRSASLSKEKTVKKKKSIGGLGWSFGKTKVREQDRSDAENQPLIQQQEQEQEGQKQPPKPTLKRFQSLSALLPPSKSTSPVAIEESGAFDSTSVSPMFSPAEVCTANVLKRRKANYAYLGKIPKAPTSSPPTPNTTGKKVKKTNKEETTTKTKSKKSHGRVCSPSLAQEAALMQFFGGGTYESNVKEVMKIHAKAVAKATGGSGTGVAVSEPHRDGRGGIWWDEDDELDYKHLLGSQDHPGQRESTRRPSVVSATFSATKVEWVMFGENGSTEEAPPAIGRPRVASLRSELRTGLLMAVEDRDTTGYVPPLSVHSPSLSPLSTGVLLRQPRSATALSAKSTPKSSFTTFAIRTQAAMSMSLLALPSRPTRMAKHLKKAGYVKDGFASSRTAKSVAGDVEVERQGEGVTGESSQSRSATPSSEASSSSSRPTTAESSSISDQSNLNKKPKRRPAPLDLSTTTSSKTSSSKHKYRKSQKSASLPVRAKLNQTQTISDVKDLVYDAKQELGAEPGCTVPLVHVPFPIPVVPIQLAEMGLKRQRSMLSMKGLFSMGGRKIDSAAIGVAI